MWGSRIETVARRLIICSLADGGLGLRDFACQSRSFRLAALVNVLQDSSAKAFFLFKDFCGSQLASIRPDWAFLRDNLTPSAARPTVFYSRLLQELRSLNFPRSFSFTSKALFSPFLQRYISVPILPNDWTSYVPTRFSFFTHWKSVPDSFTENFKNDLAWLITLRAVKVRHSLPNLGYIASARCASCPRVETIDHCVLHFCRVKSVWIHFIPLLSAMLTCPFLPTCTYVFFYQFPNPGQKNRRILLFILKSILYGISRFRNKASFHKGKEKSRGIITYVSRDIRNRIESDRHRFSLNKFRSLRTHPVLCDFRDHDNLVFCLIDYLNIPYDPGTF